MKIVDVDDDDDDNLVDGICWSRGQFRIWPKLSQNVSC